MMLFFSHRKKLAELYHKWAKENGVKDCAESVLAFLVGNELLDEDKAFEFIKEGVENDG